MMNVDIFQEKMIRPSQHSRTTSQQQQITQSQMLNNEANNNILISNTGRFYHSTSRGRNSNLEMEEEEERTAAPWTTAEQMYWNGEGDMPSQSDLDRLVQQNSTSIMSFQSNLTDSYHSQISEHSESKEEEISLLLNKVKSQNKVEASKILLAMSSTAENCITMRHCGCLPLLVDLLHQPEENSNSSYHVMHAKRAQFEVRERASQVLHNIVLSQPDDKRSRREARVLRLLENIRDYCDYLRSIEGDDNRNGGGEGAEKQQLGSSVASLMKLSFDEDHRHSMCQLGGLQAIAELLQVDQEVHGCNNDQYCVMIRRYSGMVLTNLTFGDGANKALLCSMRPFMEALVAQLYSPSEDLRQVTASVLRNLSWRADPASKRMLREVGAVTMLVKASMEAEKESTLKSILSALWNLSAHCSANKADICHVDGALAFLVSTLTYKSKSKTLAIVENGGGILRNVSSHIAIQNDYRVILRKHNCLQILLQHLKSPSLTVVSNACGTLWNLSARNAVDQRTLWEMGAVGMLKKLINSKHKMISMGSSAALKNLLSAKPSGVGFCVYGENYKSSDDAPSLMVRKQKALNTELDENLTETYDITDSPKTSPVKQANTTDKQNRTRRHISPSARYMTNQKLKNELSLPNRNINGYGLNNSVVVEEKHNGAFQVTKNAKQALSYKQNQNKNQQSGEVTQPDRKPSDTESGLVCPSGENNKHSFSSTQYNVPKVSSSDNINNKCMKKEITSGLRNVNIPSQPESSQQSVQKPIVIESKIPLPKSFIPQRSQSSSPVAQRKSASQAENHSKQTVDINITHPKRAWTSNVEKEDNEPEQVPVNFSKRQGKEHVKEGHKLFVSRIQECSSEVLHRTESAPPLSHCDLDEGITGDGRCSLNIKTNTGVRMIKNHPLLVNASNYRGDEGNDFESRYLQKHDHYGDIERGKTVDFSVQSDYEIDETLSMMSRSSSMASISSFDQQSLADEESFASDLSHRSSDIESPSELSECQTAPSSPVKTQETGREAIEHSNHTMDDQDQRDDAECDEERILPTSGVDVSTPELSEVSQGARQKTFQEKHPKVNTFDGGRVKLKNLDIKDGDIDVFSDNEEKGKEDERKAEKTRLFRIPESPVDKKGSTTNGTDSGSISKSDDIVNAKVIVDAKGNRRHDRQVKSIRGDAESVTNHLSFLMGQNRSGDPLDVQQCVFSPEDFTIASQLDESENQEMSVKTEDSDNSYFTCYTETLSSGKDKDRRSDTSDNFQTLNDSPCPHETSKPKSSEEVSEKDIDCSERDEDDETMIRSSILDEAKEIAQALLGARVDSTEDMTVSTLSCLSDIDGVRPPSVMAEIGCLSMNSSTTSEENLKIAVTKECQKLFGAKHLKKSLLRELQIGRLATDFGTGDLSKGSNDSGERSSCGSELLGNINPPSMLDEISLTASLEGSENEQQRNSAKVYRNDSMSERMNDAAAITKLYAKELSQITKNADTLSDDLVLNMKITSVVPEITEVTIADVTEIGCDTIGSDTEDDLPCDEEEFESEDTPTKRKEEDSLENLTLTEEPPVIDQQNICFMTADQLKALQENADMILNTLRDVEISDEEMGGVSNGDMLEDETMSLVSNESDEELFLSPDTQQKGVSPKPSSDCVLSPTYNGMVALPQNACKLSSKYSVRKSSLPQFSPRKKPIPRGEQQQTVVPSGSFDTEGGVFDTRTFTRKRSNIPKDLIPSIPVSSQSETNSPSSPKYINSKPEVNKPVPSRIVGIWKNSGKVRSKSAADISRGSKLQALTSGNNLSNFNKDEVKNNGMTPQRSFESSDPTFEIEDGKGVRRPSSLALVHQSPRHLLKGLPQRQKTEDSKKAVLSPSGSNIPKSFIPSRRSFIPTPAKLGEN
ncbi:adenomatous polyposis coli homolog isoform X2 [Parasteatoda tepidariorum]|uniref:adenomatous polyposis coli homolog isoform X2 n=1 Tax=Parasteatoda tepidariorum TaxID=114398 RepID=UPI0039BC5522